MNSDRIAKFLPELIVLEKILERLKGKARVEVVDEIVQDGVALPIYTIVLGTEDRTSPVLALFGGVHGLERIGTQVVLSFLQTITELLSWDEATQQLLSKARLAFMPLINPAGMMLKRRSNGNGVDLMRNAPIQGERIPIYHLHSGHRFSHHLPWYRGSEGAEMETEARALCKFVRKELFGAKVALSIDVHSGYGVVDRLWFPYARSKKPFPGLAEALALKQLLDRTYPNHIYRVEPQAHQYVTHGDLWDFLYEEKISQDDRGFFLPLTLEMGSWIWIRKNYRQLFSLLGAFNPIAHHRQQRTLRRHLLLFEFLHRAVLSGPSWAFLSPNERESLNHEGLELWYAA